MSATAASNQHLTRPLQADLEARIMRGTTYRGIPALKMPMDAWVYQELIHELQPEVVVEIGNRFGGSLLMLADLMPPGGRVVGVDLDHSQIDRRVWQDLRIHFVKGDAVEAFPRVASFVAGRSCLVIEDSAHTYTHTLAVLESYSALVQVGGYMVCEDGVMPEVARALDTFVQVSGMAFQPDHEREWPLTWNPGGYLRRVA